MCGIVAVLARPVSRPVPALDEVEAGLGEVAGLLAQPYRPGLTARAADRLRHLEGDLRGAPGLALLLGSPDAPARVLAGCAPIEQGVARIEADLDEDRLVVEGAELEELSASLVLVRDALWAIGRDRIRAAEDVGALAGGHPGVDLRALQNWWALNVALTSIDRLEVRGRDSAGVHVLVAGTDGATVAGGGRPADPLFGHGAVRATAGVLGFVYKAAAEIGELGDNVAALRAAIASDRALRAALEDPHARVTVLGHTRWASVGLISEENTHPLNSDEIDRSDGPYMVAALNGDVDNHAELRKAAGLRIPPEITTDAKVIPTLVSRAVRRSTPGSPPDARGSGLEEAFAATVRRFEGSTAIGLSAADDPDRLYLALRGSGQSLNIGLVEDAFVVASEPYGLVEETPEFLRMDGERHGGEIVVLDRSEAGRSEGVGRWTYDGQALPVRPEDVSRAAITTRDIDRRDFPHFLIKEISEAPSSFRKTLRGKVHSVNGRLGVRLGPEVVPPEVAAAVGAGRIRRVVAIGQGTAAVAGRAVAAAFAWTFPQLPVEAQLGTELSGFGLEDDMSDTLVVAVSQSGTTADTNRAVDVVRARGAWVLAIVNRRNSDLVAKAHGTMYTSDGRDVEMSVASTKAFYSQVAAGWLLALGLAAAVGGGGRSAAEVDRRLHELRALPAAMEKVLAGREHIAVVAATAPPRRYWTVVGSGPDAIAAAEVRIKLSELCYRSIACDTIEDKKHIDLSCEPLILVCAAGVSGANADDVAKDVAIFRAHKAAPVVIAAVGESGRYDGSVDVVEVPLVAPALAFVLSAMVGHLLGYEAAVAIDAQARPLRLVRAAIEAGLAEGSPLPAEEIAAAARPFHHGLAARAYDGNLEPSTAARLVAMLGYATGLFPVDGYERDTGKVGSPEGVATDLLGVLDRAVDELTRPVDAIKHQAKTVTVGTSRKEEAFEAIPLVAATVAAGASADLLGYRALRTLGRLDAAVAEVLGHTRYRVDWPADAWPSAVVVDQGGVAAGMVSRTDRDPRLLGTKHRAAEEREVTVARGASDGRPVVIVPEVKANSVIGLTLLHVRLPENLPAEEARAVLEGYRGRYNAIRDAVTETVPSFDDEVLGRLPLLDLLTEPVYVLAGHWGAVPAADRSRREPST